uniref:Uncharacterized protein n=1 Tax=Solanum tuberosum TaxID=4113 RepID=M1DGM4_SOLTU
MRPSPIGCVLVPYPNTQLRRVSGVRRRLAFMRKMGVGSLRMAEENGGNPVEMKQEVERDFTLPVMVTQLHELTTKITEVENLYRSQGRYLKIEGEHGHYFAKRNKKAEKNEENEGLRIVESTWRVAEGSHFGFCSSVLSSEGKDQVGGKRSSRCITNKFCEVVLYRPMIQSMTMSKDGARRR